MDFGRFRLPGVPQRNERRRTTIHFEIAFASSFGQSKKSPFETPLEENFHFDAGLGDNCWTLGRRLGRLHNVHLFAEFYERSPRIRYRNGRYHFRNSFKIFFGNSSKILFLKFFSINKAKILVLAGLSGFDPVHRLFRLYHLGRSYRGFHPEKRFALDPEYPPIDASHCFGLSSHFFGRRRIYDLRPGNFQHLSS